MKNFFLICFATAAVCLSITNSHALEISIGSTSTHPGNTATVDVMLSNAPINAVSAFAIYLSSTPAFGLPTVSAVQTNITLFVDDFSNGIYRVTGLVLSGPSIGNGTFARLSFAIPSNAGTGIYPITIAAKPYNAPPGANPETRTLITSAALAGTARSGSIAISPGSSMPPLITSIAHQSSGVMLLTISGESGVSYRIEASTNLTDWEQIFSTNAPGVSFQFADGAATNHVLRFYRAGL